jgi:Elongation factor Tu C-terminal domain
MEQKINSVENLQILIDIDTNDHQLKVIAKHFVSAMTDWPTSFQTNISEFLLEVKKYFGTPLTIDKIENKPLDTSNQNSWRHESGSSICEMFKLADKFYNEKSFDKIIEDILNYYETEQKNVDFVADLKYLTTEEGGRKTPAYSGYRPQVKFEFTEMQTSGQQKFLDRETVMPGENVKAAIKIISVEYFAHSLTEGMSFEFREGSRIIGNGIVISIINEQLKKASR